MSQQAAGKLALRAGVALIGLRLPVDDILAIGWSGLAVIVITVAVTYSATQWIGARTGLDRRLVTLIAMGFSICGAAAIAAVNDSIRARQRDTAIAVALVTVFGTVMIGAIPALADLLGLTDERAAIWAGASIHEVAQVAAAASVIGGTAVATAMTVKLGRVALLAPTYVVAVRSSGSTTGGGAPPAMPWFLLAFVAMVAVRSTGLLPTEAIDVADVATTVLLAAGMYGLGLGLRLRDLWPVPSQAVGLAAASTAIASGTSLLLVVALC
jgi:uncharacterized integral membrane protein (TIGR00698 family)